MKLRVVSSRVLKSGSQVGFSSRLDSNFNDSRKGNLNLVKDHVEIVVLIVRHSMPKVSKPRSGLNLISKNFRVNPVPQNLD